MLKDLTTHQLLLADVMSNISERCYYAGWMQNLEYVLWDATLTGPRQYGHDTISKQEIESLRELSKASQAWIIFDHENEETAIHLNDWKQKFHQDIELNPKLLTG